jgi:hypothetical protein
MKPSTKWLVLLTCVAAIGIGASVIIAEGSLADFGVTEARLKSGLVNAFAEGHLPLYPSQKAYAAASPAMRVAFVKSLFGFVKTYAETPAFKADYDRRRAAAKPASMASKGSVDDQYAKKMAEQQKSIEEMKANISKMPAEMQKSMQEAVQQMEASLAQTSKDSQMTAMMKQGIAQENESSQQDFQKRMADYEARYPADPKIIIAKRLREFLDVSKDVAYDAKLVPMGGGKMKFADPNLESKSEYWKLCFRAGKEPVDAARVAANEWLRQLAVK